MFNCNSSISYCWEKRNADGIIKIILPVYAIAKNIKFSSFSAYLSLPINKLGLGTIEILTNQTEIKCLIRYMCTKIENHRCRLSHYKNIHIERVTDTLSHSHSLELVKYMYVYIRFYFATK